MSIQILLDPISIDNKSLNLHTTTLNTLNLNVESLNTQIVNFRPPDVGLLGDVLASSGNGSVYWTSNPAPPSSGILYNGTLPAITNRLLKISNSAGNSANESSILETPTELNLTANIPFKTVKTIFTDSQEFVSKLYVDSIPTPNTTTINDASGVVNSIISSNVSPNFLMKGISSSTGINLASVGNNIEITNTLPSNLITLNNVGTNSLISSNANPSFNLKGLTASTGITLASVGNDIEITNNLPSSLITLNNVGTNSLIASNTNPSFTTKGLIAGTDINISSTATDLIINNSNPASSITLSNVGTNSLIASNTNPSFTTKGLIAGSNISISATATDLIIANSNPASSITLTNSGIGNTLLNSTINPNFTTKGLIAGSNISLTSTATDITINNTIPIPTSVYTQIPFSIGTESTLLNSSSYFNMGMIDKDITIASIKFFITDPYISGSPMLANFGLFRGVLSTGSVLVGQASVNILTNDFNLKTVNFTAQPSQNLNFVAGEIIFVGHCFNNMAVQAFISTGTGDLDTTFSVATNYTAGFPATLTTALSRVSTNVHLCCSFFS